MLSSPSAPATENRPRLPDGLVAVVKHDCPTCQLVAPLLGQIAPAAVYVQDDPAPLHLPAGLPVVDDAELAVSYALGIEIVPTLLRVRDGAVVERTEGWERGRWRELTGLPELGAELPALRP